MLTSVRRISLSLRCLHTDYTMGAGYTRLAGTGSSWDLLKAQSAATSAAVIEAYAGDSAFSTLSEQQGSAIIQRDAEDDEKLQASAPLPLPQPLTASPNPGAASHG